MATSKNWPAGRASSHRINLHGDLGHTTDRRGEDSNLQSSGLGESISYQRGSFYAFLDVGFRGAQVRNLYPRHPDLDILILTHNDHDHIGDIESFLAPATRRVKEIWLPYEWRLLFDLGKALVERLAGDTEPNEDVDDVRDAREEIAQAIGRIRAAFDIPESEGTPDWLDEYETDSRESVPHDDPAAYSEESIAETYDALDAIGNAVHGILTTNDDPDAIDNFVESAVNGGDNLLGSNIQDYDRPSSVTTLAGVARQVSKSVKQGRIRRGGLGTDQAVAGSVTGEPQGADQKFSATRARATAMAVNAAHKSGARLRWFSVDHAIRFPRIGTNGDAPWQRSGKAKIITVVNAWPVVPAKVAGAPRTVEDDLLFALAYATLTMQNRRALVTLGHPLETIPTYWCDDRRFVLFASDSGFEFDKMNKRSAATVEVPWDLISVVVGLHHGSASPDHNHVYEMLQWPSLLCRSGSPSTHKTNTRFSNHPARLRGCTWCHRDSDARENCKDRTRDVVIEQSEEFPYDWRLVNGLCTDCPRFG